MPKQSKEVLRSVISDTDIIDELRPIYADALTPESTGGVEAPTKSEIEAVFSST